MSCYLTQLLASLCSIGWLESELSFYWTNCLTRLSRLVYSGFGITVFLLLGQLPVRANEFRSPGYDFATILHRHFHVLIEATFLTSPSHSDVMTITPNVDRIHCCNRKYRSQQNQYCGICQYFCVTKPARRCGSTHRAVICILCLSQLLCCARGHHRADVSVLQPPSIFKKEDNVSTNILCLVVYHNYEYRMTAFVIIFTLYMFPVIILFCISGSMACSPFLKSGTCTHLNIVLSFGHHHLASIPSQTL